MEIKDIDYYELAYSRFKKDLSEMLNVKEADLAVSSPNAQKVADLGLKKAELDQQIALLQKKKAELQKQIDALSKR